MNTNSKIEQIGTMEFMLRDYTEDRYNQSVDCSFEIWGDKNKIDDILSIEEYYNLCIRFAAAMGFSEKVIFDWFGEK